MTKQENNDTGNSTKVDVNKDMLNKLEQKVDQNIEIGRQNELLLVEEGFQRAMLQAVGFVTDYGSPEDNDGWSIVKDMGEQQNKFRCYMLKHSKEKSE